MKRCLVFARSLGGSHAGSVRRLWRLVLPSAPWCAVGLSQCTYKLPVHSFVSGCLIASVAGGHQDRGGLVESLQ